MEILEKEITRIVIIEDNEVVKDGFALLLNGMTEFSVPNSYTNCEDAIKKLRKDKPDIVLMDLELPGMHGIEGIKIIKKEIPYVSIVVITVHDDSSLVFEALCAGAAGYITKTANYSSLLEAIEEVKAGGAPMSSNIAKMVVESFQRNQNTPLTKRETQILGLLAKGKSYTVIAGELFIHKETVKSHIKNIYAKLRVHSKADAIEIATKERYI